MSAPALPYGFARTQGVLLIAHHEDSAEILLREGADISVISEVRRHLGVPLRIAGRIGRALFETRLAEIYGQGENDAAEVVQDLGQDIDILKLMQELPTVEDLLDSQDDAPIIRLINALFTQAVHEHASDIHVEPYEQNSVVRFRRDGMLRDVAQPHRGLHAAMSSRIKIMASLDIAERRLPQDGRITLRVGNRAVDVRVSTIPTMHGERLVLRLLEKDAGRLQLATLGMPEDVRTMLASLLAMPHGVVLITGPTGSGKTTTLYAALHTLDRKSRNIVTVEDPVEYDVAGVGQVQVNSRIELGFARALRAILRQDPDVIMIGEIRDLETAEIAVQASLTGHLVLATLHTNDAAAAVTRLVDMGVESFLLASSLRGVLAQRLVRCLCKICRQSKGPGEFDHALLGAACPTQLWSPVGCVKCNHTGYSGRTGIYEFLLADEELIKLIHEGAAEAVLRAYSRTKGSRSLRDDGIRLLVDGTTSLEELLRVSGEA